MMKSIAKTQSTDAGSEATPIIGQTENDKEGKPLKTTQKTVKVGWRRFWREQVDSSAHKRSIHRFCRK